MQTTSVTRDQAMQVIEALRSDIQAQCDIVLAEEPDSDDVQAWCLWSIRHRAARRALVGLRRGILEVMAEAGGPADSEGWIERMRGELISGRIDHEGWLWGHIKPDPDPMAQLAWDAAALTRVSTVEPERLEWVR